MWERGGRARWAEEPRPTAHIVSTSSRASISGGGSPNGQSIAQCSFYRTVQLYTPDRNPSKNLQKSPCEDPSALGSARRAPCYGGSRILARDAHQPIPLMQMCTEQNQRAIDLERQGLLTVLHFDDIRNQTSRPIKDARNWIARKNARKAPRKKRLSPNPNLGSKLRVRAHTVIKHMQKLTEMLEELRSEAADFEESGTKHL